MKQTHTQKFESSCKKAIATIDNDMSACALYEFALELKTHAYNIIKADQEKDQKAKEVPCEVISDKQ